MTLGELIAHIAKAGQRLQRANPDMTIDEFHAIPVVVYDHDHDFTHGLQRAGIETDEENGERSLKLEISASILETKP